MVSKQKTFCILEQGDSVNRSSTLHKKVEFTTEFSDFYRLNWKRDDDPNAIVSQENITWSEGCLLLFRQVPKDYDYYIFTDENIQFSAGQKSSVAEAIRQLLENWKPVAGTFYTSQINGDRHQSMPPDRQAFPIVGFDTQVHIFHRDFAEWMFPVLIQGSGCSMRYAQWICHQLWPSKQMCFTDVEIINADANPHQDRDFDQFTDAKTAVSEFNQRFVRRGCKRIPSDYQTVRKLNLELYHSGAACSKSAPDITRNQLLTYLKAGYFKQLESSPYYSLLDLDVKNGLDQWDCCTKYASQGKHIVLTFASVGYIGTASKWARLIEKHGIDHYVIVCMDDRSFAALSERGFNVVRLNRRFKTLWLFRLHVINFLLERGLTVTHSDVDAYWLQDPFKAIEELTDAAGVSKSPPDVYFSQASIFPESVFKKRGLVVCCGFFQIKSNSNTLKLFKQIIASGRRNGDDQKSSNYTLDRLMDGWSPAGDSKTRLEDLKPDRVFRFRGHQVATYQELLTTNADECSVAVLPHRLFQRLAENSEEVPVVAHHILR